MRTGAPQNGEKRAPKTNTKFRQRAWKRPIREQGPDEQKIHASELFSVRPSVNAKMRIDRILSARVAARRNYGKPAICQKKDPSTHGA